MTGDEFVMLISMLGKLKSLNTLQGRSQIIELIVEQAALDEQFEVKIIEGIYLFCDFFEINYAHSVIFKLWGKGG